MRTGVPLLFLSLLLLPFLLIPASTADGRGRSRERWPAEKVEKLLSIAREYLVATRKREKDSLLKRADELGPIPDRDVKSIVKELFEVARSGPKSDGAGECTAKYEPFPGHYLLGGTGGGKKGIFIGLHGGGAGVGEGETARSQWGGASGKGLITVFPTANLPNRATTWQSPEVEGFVLAIIRELKRTYTIDTNRIYIAGHSLGGSGAYFLGLRNADIFAAVSPNAGGLKGHPISATETRIPGGFVANLFNTPIFITHYDQDPRVYVQDSRAVAKELDELQEKHPGGYKHVYIEGQGVNHGFPPKGNPNQIIAWMTKFKRDPYPEKLIWEPGSPEKRLFSWLRMASPPAAGSRNARIVATIGKNRIEIQGSMVWGLSVMLSEEMFKPDRPLTVVVNGETKFEGIAERRPAALVESIVENIDPEQVFEYRVDLGM